MASVHARVLALAQNVSTGTTNLQSITNSKALAGDINFLGFLDVSSFAATSVDVKIQHSHDGVNWEDLITFTQAVGNGVEYKDVDASALDHVLGYLRAQIVVVGGTATVTCKALYDRAYS